MKIAFIHYHLKTGGVATVLHQQVEAIHGVCEVLVLTSKPPSVDYPATSLPYLWQMDGCVLCMLRKS